MSARDSPASRKRLPSAAGTARWLRERGRRVRWLPLLTFLVVTFAFMPKALLGLGVFAPLDILEYASPWRDVLATPPHVSEVVQNDFVQAIPVLEALVSAIRHGHWLVWSPYVAGGEPVGTLPNSGLQSPFNLLLVLLPVTWGLGAVAAVQLLFSQLFFYLFLRRLRFGVAIATFGAVAYTFCGTNVVLLGRINAYLILPALLWAVTRVLQRRRPGDVALLAIASALTWLEGFPAGFVNAVAIAVLLSLFLVLPSAAHRGGSKATLKQAAAGLALVGCGFALSAGLVAISVLPFERTLTQSGLLSQRSYTSVDHLPSVLLPEALSVGALGNLHQPVLMPTREPNGAIGGAGNAVELEGGAGLVVVATAFGGMFLALLGRVRLTRQQRGLYLFGLASLVGGLLLVYFDTPLLQLFYDLPLLGVSSANRFRIIINLGFVLVACLGLEGFLAFRRAPRGDEGTAKIVPGGDLPIRVASGVALAALVAIGADVWPAYHGWLETPLARNVRREVGFEALGGVAACLLAYFMIGRAARGGVRASALVTSVGLGLALATFATVAYPIRSFTPTVSKSLFFPTTPGQTELQKLTDQKYRILGSGLATFYSNTSIYYHYLDLRGLSFSTPSFRALVRSAIPDAYELDYFKVIYDPTLGTPINFNSPALDDLGVRYYVEGTNETPLANNVDVVAPVATHLLNSTSFVSRTIRRQPRLTGFGIPVQRNAGCNGARLVVNVRSLTGQPIATAVRPAIDAPTASVGALAFTIPVLGADRPRHLRVSIGVTGQGCRIAAGVNRAGQLTVSQLVEPPHGLPIAADLDGVFYERVHAHPIVWVANNWMPAGSASDALKLATARSRRTTDPIPAAGAGSPIDPSGHGHVDQLRYVSDGFDVRTTTSGRSLIATGFAGSADDWSVHIDGRAAKLVSVDGALLGAVVGPGVHTASFRYEPPDLFLGAAVSGLSLVILLALAVLDRRPRSRWGSRFGRAASEEETAWSPPTVT